ncbi:hypothetical protein PIB30_020691 [Stylosanthes scabra]|uniref:Uncharacterized protein n=1 Tax=Stylosanthes scabra TaxID=79078 RepID=A0ABU6W862_9FABA|nr:hypothetical protein [Stylosanthes scabra]
MEENKGLDQFNGASKAKYDCLLFDLDDTFYPFSSGMSVQIGKKVIEYMIQKIDGIEDVAKASELCVALYKTYGTVLAGLKAFGHDFDNEDFNSFVHETLPYDDILKPDPVLKEILQSLPIRKIIFTNADNGHAVRVLRRLGLEECFERIIDFDTLNSSNDNNMDPTHHDYQHGIIDHESKPAVTSRICDFDEYMKNPYSSDKDMVLPRTPVVCKPFEYAFQKLFKIANINPQRTLFFDDSIRNLLMAKSFGIHTVAVGTCMETAGVDHTLKSIHDIRKAFPELWE